jgi:3-dehydro-L-gulonate 2-dehydrogenase
MPDWGVVDSRIGNNPLVFAFPRKRGEARYRICFPQRKIRILGVSYIPVRKRQKLEPKTSSRHIDG